MKLTEEQIVKNWDKLICILEEEFSGERKTNLLEMYKHFEERMAIAPASGLIHYHNCFAGGYVDHILRVIDALYYYGKHGKKWELTLKISLERN